MAALGVGVGYGISARGSRNDLENTCQPMGDAWLCQQSDRDAFESYSQANITADIGFGLGAVGLGLALWQTFKPLPSPDLNALSLEHVDDAVGAK